METQALQGGDTAPDVERRDSRCPACSTPVRSGMLRLYERGEFYHAYCRSRQLERAALEQNDGGAAPQAGVAGSSPSGRLGTQEDSLQLARE